MLRVIAGIIVLGLAWGIVELAGSEACVSAQDKKKEKDAKEGKKGTVIGTLTAKDKNFIEVKADGEENPRKYIPQWVGGAPANGGGPDKKMVKTISELKVGSRIEVEWLFHEHLRVMDVKVLKAAPEKDKN